MSVARLCALLAVTWIAQTGTSWARYDYDWLDKLSGPGSFHGFSVSYRFLCIARTANGSAIEHNKVWIKPLDASSGLFGRRLPTGTPPPSQAETNCKLDKDVAGFVSVAGGALWSKDNDLFSTDDHGVRIYPASVSYTARLTRWLDASSGIGATFFTGPDFDAFSRLTLNVLSLEPHWKMLKFKIGLTTFIGGLDSDDFCNPAKAPGGCSSYDTTFVASKERVLRIAISFDPTLR